MKKPIKSDWGEDIPHDVVDEETNQPSIWYFFLLLLAYPFTWAYHKLRGKQ